MKGKEKKGRDEDGKIELEELATKSPGEVLDAFE